MSNLTPEGLRLVSEVAQRHGFSTDAAVSLLNSLSLGNGSQAQFNHHELGGMGQWSQGGMIMIGDMFNQGLKYRVDGLCKDLSNLLRNQPLWQPEARSYQSQSHQSQSQGGGDGVSLFVSRSGGGGGSWWPADLGSPGSTGAQNDMRYAYFPNARRLALNINGQVRVYDTGDHMVSGFSQQQSGDQSVTFNSQYGIVRVADLPLVFPAGDVANAASASANAPPPSPTSDWAQSSNGFVSAQNNPGPPSPAPEPPASFGVPPSTPSSTSTQDVFAMIERLAELRQKNILTDEEFAAKKGELLSRL